MRQDLAEGPLQEATPGRGLRSRILPTGSGLAVFLAGEGVDFFWPEAIRLLFRVPAAETAARFLGAEVERGGESPTIVHPGIEVGITEACAGYDFFCLLLALVVGWEIHRRGFRGERISVFLWALPIAYLITLFANVSRIVCAVEGRLLTRSFLPESFQPILHQAIGVAVFVSILFVSWTALTKLHEARIEP